ncbi:MAG: hypothetical protein QOF98_1562 [Streptomyces sp.]|nr:hypothetical protein [Streptomyces sp.]
MSAGRGGRHGGRRAPDRGAWGHPRPKVGGERREQPATGRWPGNNQQGQGSRSSPAGGQPRALTKLVQRLRQVQRQIERHPHRQPDPRPHRVVPPRMPPPNRKQHPHRHLAGGVPYAPTERQTAHDAQPTAPVRGQRRTGRPRPGGPATIRHLKDEQPVGSDRPRRSYPALKTTGGRLDARLPSSPCGSADSANPAGTRTTLVITQRTGMPTRVAEQLGNDQDGVICHRLRYVLRVQVTSQPSACLRDAGRTMGQGHGRGRRHFLRHHQRHPRDLLLHPTPQGQCPL